MQMSLETKFCEGGCPTRHKVGCLGYTGWGWQLLLILLIFWACLEGWLWTLRTITFMVPFVASPSAPGWSFLSMRRQHTSPVSFVMLIAVLLSEDNDISKTKGQLQQPQLTASAVTSGADQGGAVGHVVNDWRSLWNWPPDCMSLGLKSDNTWATTLLFRSLATDLSISSLGRHFHRIILVGRDA